MKTTIIFQTSSNLGQIRPRTAELAALERLEKSPKTYNGQNVVTSLAHSFLIESFPFLQIRRIGMKAWMSSNFGQISPPTTELSALASLKN